MTDIIDLEAEVTPGSQLDTIRRGRPGARVSSQESFHALFEPDDERGFVRAERAAVADFVATLTGVPIGTYRAIVVADDPGLAQSIALAAHAAVATGPFGHYPRGPLSAENTDGLRWTASAEDVIAFGPRLSAALEHAHLLVYRPREASAEALRALSDAGWTTDTIVTLSQLITFVTYQVRVIQAARVLGAADRPTDGALRPGTTPVADARPLTASDPRRPSRFTQDRLWWEPWLEPIDRAALTPEQKHGLVEPARAALPYFRLLARDPGILRARTLADNDIFTNTDGGLPRAERELTAAAVSRVNGCLFCASVHARTAAQFSKRPDAVQALLDSGVGVSIDPRWDAVITAAAAIAPSPVAFAAEHVHALEAQGLSAVEIFDLASSAAFFSWANRLMLSLGEPVVPEDTSVIREYEATRR